MAKTPKQKLGLYFGLSFLSLILTPLLGLGLVTFLFGIIYSIVYGIKNVWKKGNSAPVPQLNTGEAPKQTSNNAMAKVTTSSDPSAVLQKSQTISPVKGLESFTQEWEDLKAKRALLLENIAQLKEKQRKIKDGEIVALEENATENISLKISEKEKDLLDLANQAKTLATKESKKIEEIRRPIWDQEEILKKEIVDLEKQIKDKNEELGVLKNTNPSMEEQLDDTIRPKRVKNLETQRDLLIKDLNQKQAVFDDLESQARGLTEKKDKADERTYTPFP